MAHDYSFSGDIKTNSKLYEAYKTAMDIRKFEIELYWKRATYFWTFIGLSLAAYGAALIGKAGGVTPDQRGDILFAIACTGLVFAIAWYFVNRGSKFWQRNWEYQVDILESKALGPLYKTVFADTNTRFFHLTSAYPFSVSNINHILSLFVILIFLLLAIYSVPCLGCQNGCHISWPKIVIGLFSSAFIYLLFHYGRASVMRKNGEQIVKVAPVVARYSVRTIEIVE